MNVEVDVIWIPRVGRISEASAPALRLKSPAPEFGTVGFADSCVLCTRYFLFCAVARVSLTSAIELAEASLETD
jgi:hypothetical protein